MMTSRFMRHSLAGLLLVPALIPAIHTAPIHAAEPRPGHDFGRWQKDIERFSKADRESPFPAGEIVFVGSSSIRLWKLDEAFPDCRILNRGFGGSEIVDSIHFADTLVLKHRPRLVVLYAGDNDVSKGRSPAEITSDFKDFVTLIHQQMPETRIAFIAIKPSIKRWNLIDAIRTANRQIAGYCEQDKRLEFVDIATPMLGDDRKPRPELFADDGLHLNAEGYRLWNRIMRPLLKQ